MNKMEMHQYLDKYNPLKKFNYKKKLLNIIENKIDYFIHKN